MLTTFSVLVFGLIEAMNASCLEHGMAENGLQHLNCSEPEFFEVCKDFPPQEISEAIELVKRDRWESSNVVMSAENGFRGYYWTRIRPQKKGRK